MTFSTRLKEVREQRGLSRAELATKLGVTASAISNYENGVSSPKEDILLALFSTLEVEPNFLFQDSYKNTLNTKGDNGINQKIYLQDTTTNNQLINDLSLDTNKFNVLSGSVLTRFFEMDSENRNLFLGIARDLFRAHENEGTYFNEKEHAVYAKSQLDSEALVIHNFLANARTNFGSYNYVKSPWICSAVLEQHFKVSFYWKDYQVFFANDKKNFFTLSDIPEPPLNRTKVYISNGIRYMFTNEIVFFFQDLDDAGILSFSKPFGPPIVFRNSFKVEEETLDTSFAARNGDSGTTPATQSDINTLNPSKLDDSL